MNPGRFDRRVTFTRRATDGAQKGKFAPLLTLWANYTRGSGREAVESGRLTDVEAGTLRIRDSAAARGLTIDDRALIAGVEFRLQAIALPERRSGTIDITVSTSRLAGR